VSRWCSARSWRSRPRRSDGTGRVQAQGSPLGHARLGPLEDWLEENAGPGVIDGIAGRAVLRDQYVKGERERLLAKAFMIRVLVLMTLVPGAGVRDAVIALAGDLAVVPWARAWVPAPGRALGDWRNALGPEPLEELQDIVHRASWAEHEDRDWRAVIIGRSRPLKAGSTGGTLIRVPGTPANRAAFGSVGTADDSSPFPQVRALPLNDACTRGLLGMPRPGRHGQGRRGAGTAGHGRGTVPAPVRRGPDLADGPELSGRGPDRPAGRAHPRADPLKSDIPLKQISQILPDGSCLAELSGDGVTVTVRVTGYWVTVEGQQAPEMFCLVTDLLDWREYPAAELAALYRWRWDGSEAGLREAKASLRGAGPSAGPMLRSGSPGLVRQELAAWAAATEMTRGVARAAALAAAPARKGRRAGKPVQAREISHGRARRAVTAAIRAGRPSYTALTSDLAQHRTVIDRNRHRARKARCASTFPRASRADTATRTAPAIITLANMPA
jgi:hypothetical protein